jgi:excisionase family DNA binding protein
MNKLLSLREVAPLIGVSLSTVRRWASCRKIPLIKIGGRVLVDAAALDKLIDAHRIDPAKGIAI